MGSPLRPTGYLDDKEYAREDGQRGSTRRVGASNSSSQFPSNSTSAVGWTDLWPVHQIYGIGPDPGTRRGPIRRHTTVCPRRSRSRVAPRMLVRSLVLRMRPFLESGSKMHTYIVTVTAADRVGIVHSVWGRSTTIEATILELGQDRHVRGYFTIIVAVEFEQPQDPDALGLAIAEGGKPYDMTVAVRLASEEDRRPPVPNGERFILTVLGDDHPERRAWDRRLRFPGLGVDIVDRCSPGSKDRGSSPVMEAHLPARPARLRWFLGDLEQVWEQPRARRRSSSTRTSSRPPAGPPRSESASAASPSGAVVVPH